MSHEDRVPRSRRLRNEEAAPSGTVGEAVRARAEPTWGIFDLPEAELGMLLADMMMPGASPP